MDSIANMFSAIKNGQLAKKDYILVPYSKFKANILKVLEKEGYILGHKKIIQDKKEFLQIQLKYKADGTPAISEIKRISKPGRRLYTGVKDIPKVLSGYGIAILSTPKGVMSDKEAKKYHTGGEIVGFVW